MKKICTLLSLSIFSMASAFLTEANGQMQANLLSTWDDPSLIQTSWLSSVYNEVWGIAVNGGEYGIIGSTEGIHIIDVTDPTNAEEIHMMDGAAIGTNLVHRDCKTYAGHIYCVADEGFSSTLQIIDATGLPEVAEQVYSSNEFVVTAHNIFIDEANARLYLIGQGNGLQVLDISTPDQPQLLGTGGNVFVPYCHDAYVRDHIAYLNCGSNYGFWVVDYTDPNAPVVLGTMDDYPEQGYNHSGWLSDDGQYYFLLDETHSTSMKTVDVSDFSNMSVVALFRPGNWDDEIAHNAIVRGDRLYVSYYYDGLVVYDISDPVNPELVAYYDTYCQPNEDFYAGMWGIYPLLPSGNILGSDMQTGLYVFEHLPEVILDLSLQTIEPPTVFCEGSTATFSLEIGADFSTDGVSLSTDALPANISVEFSENPAMPGSAVEVSIISESGADSPLSFEVFADDGNTVSSRCFSLEIAFLPNETFLVMPPNESEVELNNAVFGWLNVPSVSEYEIQFTDSSGDFEGNLLFSDDVFGENFYNISPQDAEEILNSGTAPYYWRVLTKNDCGAVPSGTIRNFYFPGTNATGELSGAALNVYPSPATDKIYVQFDQSIGADLNVELTSLTGQVLSQNDFAAPQGVPWTGGNTLTLDVSNFAAGLYLLKITDGEAAHVQQVVVK